MIKFYKKHKPVFYIIVVMLFLTILINVVLISTRYQKEVSLQIKDTNGNSKQLCFITDEMIGEITEDYRAIRKRVVSEGNNSSGIKGHFSDCDSEKVETTVGMLSGIYVCNSYLGSGQKVEYTVESKVKSGNMRIIITDEKNVILYDIPIDAKESISFVAEKSKVYYVKLIGESAEIDIRIDRKILLE